MQDFKKLVLESSPVSILIKRAGANAFIKELINVLELEENSKLLDILKGKIEDLGESL